MNIVIAGAGEVGFHLSNMLSREAHDIVIIDTNEEKLDIIVNHMDVMTILGSATSIKILEDARIRSSDLFIAVTSSEEVNISAAIFAKELGVKTTVSRVSNHEYLSEKKISFKKLGIDHIIYPEELAAEEITELIKHPELSEVHDFSNGKLSLVGLILHPDAPTVNKSLIDIVSDFPNVNCNAVAIHRDDKTIIPRGNTKFLANDHVYFITPPSELDNILKLTGRDTFKVDDIMILGGSKIGKHTAELLQNNHKIKLIEKDKNKAFQFADSLSKTLVLHGNCNDINFLEEEGLKEMDAFIAVTGDSETNIIACLMAKRFGIQKTIAAVNNIDYLDLSQNLGIDTLINKKFIAASKILKYIRKGEVLDITSLPSADAEVLEFIVKDGSNITKSSVKSLNFPETAIIGGIIRNNESYIATGDFIIQPDDEVIVFALPGSIQKVEKYFK